MHPAIPRLGFNGATAAIADSFRRSLVHQGIPEAQAIEVLAWYSRSFADDNVSADDAWNALSHEAAQRGWPETVLDATLGWHTAVAEAGGDPSVIQEPGQPAFTSGDARRLAEISKIMHEDRAQYFGDPQLQDEYRLLLERNGGKLPDRLPSNNTTQDRKRELQKMMADRSGDYYRGPFAAGLQSEYRGLVGGTPAEQPKGIEYALD
jgi:hypothetical protein